MALRDELLVPIPGANPAGAELRYDSVYDRIKEARREDDDAPQGDWQTERKVADWPLVIKLTKDALSKKSKDLQLAVWLTEAMLRREGIAGLRAGLDLIDGMVDQYWDGLFPAVEDGDVEMRAAPLDWAGSRLDLVVRQAPANRSGHTFLQYEASRLIPSETEAAEDDSKRVARETAVADGKVMPEAFELGFTATPKAWYKALAADVAGALETLQQLDERSQERFGQDAPSFGKLRAALEEVRRVTGQLLKRKLEVEPDAPEFNAAGVPPEADIGAPPLPNFAGAAPPPAVVVGAGRPLAAEAASRDDAAARIVSAARYLRQSDPYNPASYLLLRGFRWGELRAGGQQVDPRLLEAPATPVRTQLKMLLLDGKWKELIETCETVMGTPQGRGWIDLQRYALTACDSLEAGYHFVGRAIRAELRTLLADLPQLLEMTLMDDTPTANAETRAWLRNSVLSEGAAIAAAGTNGNGAAEGDGEPRPRDVRALAQAEARAGRAERGIAILTRELEREKTRRGRFLYQTQLAKIMVDAGHEAVAKPLLEELIGSIEAHKLEEWEAGDLIAQPLALLYRCLEKLDGDSDTKQALYLRICRLDPLQAISFANGTQASQPQ